MTSSPESSSSERPAFLRRVATAPISWGVCEVPGWGVQLPPETVLAEMAGAGFTHTELGSFGYLPTEPESLRRLLDRHGLSLLGAFIPLVLHDDSGWPVATRHARDAAELLAAVGATFFVTAVVADGDEWGRIELDDEQWATVCRALDRLDEICAGYGLVQVVHPHVGTIVEQAGDVQRVLDGSGAKLCLDTAHLTIGGADPLAMAKTLGDRIGLAHLKDLDTNIVTKLTGGELSLMESVQAGIFPRLGLGAVPIAEIVTALENSTDDLWYVLEQDMAIVEGDPSALAIPVLNMKQSIGFLEALPVASATGPSANETNREKT